MKDSVGGVYHPLVSVDVRALKFMMMATAADFALYGVQTILTIASIVILARRHGRSRFTLMAVLGLFLLSTISTATAIKFYYVQFAAPPDAPGHTLEVVLYWLDILLSTSSSCSYVLSDAVLAWRAWCLWPGRRLVKGTLLSLLGASIVGAIAERAWIYSPGLAVLGTIESIDKFLTMIVPLLITNAVATLLIGVKVMYYRGEIKGALTFFTRKTQAEAVLLLLLESGIAYILFWAVDIVLWNIAVDSDPFSGVLIYTSIAHHIAGIYPTLVLFVAMRGTTEPLTTTQVSQAMRFAGPHEMCDAKPALGTLPGHSASPPDVEPEGSYADNLPCPPGTCSERFDAASSEGHRPKSCESLLQESREIWRPESSDGYRPASSENLREPSEGVPDPSDGIFEVPRESTAM